MTVIKECLAFCILSSAKNMISLHTLQFQQVALSLVLSISWLQQCFHRAVIIIIIWISHVVWLLYSFIWWIGILINLIYFIPIYNHLTLLKSWRIEWLSFFIQRRSWFFWFEQITLIGKVVICIQIALFLNLFVLYIWTSTSKLICRYLLLLVCCACIGSCFCCWVLVVNARGFFLVVLSLLFNV